MGNPSRATEHATRALAVHQATGYRIGAARALTVLGQAARHPQQHTPAAAHWRAAVDLFADIGAPEADQVRQLLTADQAGGLNRPDES